MRQLQRWTLMIAGRGGGSHGMKPSRTTSRLALAMPRRGLAEAPLTSRRTRGFPLLLCRLGRQFGRSGKRLVEIGENIVDVLDADGKSHIAGCHAARQLIGGLQLRVRGGSRVDGPRAGIADGGGRGEKLGVLDRCTSRPVAGR